MSELKPGQAGADRVGCAALLRIVACRIGKECTRDARPRRELATASARAAAPAPACLHRRARACERKAGQGGTPPAEGHRGV